MNCLLLLIILFCCNGNGNCGTRNCGRRNSCRNDSNTGNRCNVPRNISDCNTENRSAGTTNTGSRIGRDDDYDRSNRRRDCDCDMSANVQTCPTAPPRTQFPYLDVEPRTCGCEEKNE